MPRVAFLSMPELTGFVADDEIVRAPLAHRGWQLDVLPWNTEIDWDAFDAVVLRSTWDYQDHLPEFLRALDRIERSRAHLYNPLEIVRWNARKTYLRELADRGVPVVPSRFGCRPEGPDLDELFRTLETDDLVLKPTVGASAFDTFRVKRAAGGVGPPPDPVRGRFGGEIPILALDGPTRERVAGAFRGREYIAQPFVPEILDPGEHSLFFFDGRYSHAILKTPKAGDFRVQEEHGGRILPASVPLDLVEAARTIVALLEPTPLYARVDLVRRDELFLLMELELIEPALYFRTAPGSAERFADALLSRLARDRESGAGREGEDG